MIAKHTKALCFIVASLFLLASVAEIEAVGRRGGSQNAQRGGNRGRVGGGSRQSRPQSRPTQSRPNTSSPYLGASRPSGGRANYNRPSNVSRPNVSRSQPSRPHQSRPQVSRPQGGLRPTTRPPSSRPQVGGQRPGSRPIGRPGVGQPNIAQRPVSRPNISIPDLGGSRPEIGGGAARPGGNLAGRPNLGLPNVRPGTGDRPSARPGGTRPGGGNRPVIDGGGRPGIRPTPGDVGDFLGMNRPIRPSTRPALPHRPGNGNRPERPGGNRPGDGDRPNWADRPWWGNRPGGWGNNNINHRPGWVNIDNSTNIKINNNWNNAFTRPARPGWWERPRDRYEHWHGWGNHVRDNWHHHNHHHHWFNDDWWHHHHHDQGGWNYYHTLNNRPWNYWWTAPTWNSFSNWFTWSSAPATVWTQPVYYDYGTGGNVTYENNIVYVGGQQVAMADEFAQSAANLATVEPPASEEEAVKSDWMPLGTFAVSANEKEVEPSRVIQLAVNKDGIVSGTLYNTETDAAQTVQGRVDKETQRVAFRIGSSEEIIVETGLYNLTQDEAPLLVHFGDTRQENYLLVRLEAPAGGQ